MDSDKQGFCQLVDSISMSGSTPNDEFTKDIEDDTVTDEMQVLTVTPVANDDPLSEVNKAESAGTITETTQNEEKTSEEASDSRSKSAFKVNVNAIESVSIEDQADEIKNLGLKVFDQHTLEKGIWDQVEHESQRLQTEEELAILDTTIKKKELLLKKSAIKLKSKQADGSKPEQKQMSELADLQAKQSLLRERLTQGLKLKENEESERERSIRLGEMTPFGTIVSAQSSGLPPSLSQYLKKQQELQMKMQERKQVKRKMSSNNATERRKDVKGQSQNNVANLDTESSSSSTPEKIQARRRKRKEKLGSKLAMSSGQSHALNPGEVETMDLDESGSEYVPSEDSFDEFNEEGDAESPEFEGDDEKKKTKSKQKIICDKPKKRKTSVGGSRPKRKRVQIAQDPEDWATDDSDWICTDDEISSGSEDPARKRKRLVKKEKDDGNEDDFYRRMKQWEKSNPGLREEMEGDCHELQNDFKVPRKMWDKLYKYQQVGVQWFWELHQQGCGGILGDEMGLGKTVQVIAFLAGLRLSRIKSTLLGYRSLGPVLIVCPTTVMHQWVREFHTWFPPLRVAVLHESGTFQGKRDHLIKNMVKARGVVITSYTAVVRLKDALLDAHWHYIVLDEGHKIRNPDAQVTMVVKQFRTPHRIILSGSPVQNHLRELWSLMDFVFPGKLGTLPVFMAQFGVPIVQGGYANASEVMVATAFKCATVLKDTITPYLLRRMKTDVNNHISLPPKNEQVLFCRLTDQQRDLYKGYLDCGEVGRILDGRLQIFVGLINLRKICNHPHLYSGGPKLFAGESEDRIPVEDRYGHWSKAGKMIVMEALLKMWHRQEHRVLIFTQSKQMLGIMESFIIQEGYKYLKLDGGTSISARQPLINKYNQDKSYFVMILTTKVGGLGVNLTGADRVVIYDPDWNPATDTQARERAWRIGQQNCVTVYRLITAGTIEEKMYHRQIFKQFLCNKVLKDPRQRRFFKSNDLLELFTLKEVDTEGSTETSAIFAGTGSQVHVKKKKSIPKKEEAKSPPKRVEPSQRAPESNKAKASPSPKESKSIVSRENDRSSSRKSTKQPVSVQFSESKLQHMKQLAAMLSKKLAKKADDAATTGNASTDVGTTPIKKTDGATGEDVKTSADAETAAETSVTHSRSSADEAFPHTSLSSGNLDKETSQNADAQKPGAGDENREKENRCAVPVPLVQKTLGDAPDADKTSEKNLKRSEEKQAKEPKKHKKHKKHKKERNAKFEGERVPHLVRSSAMKAEETVDEIAHNSKQDDYVLRKLFSKTGLQTAMQHEKIMEGGHADYALIEGEAKKVAQEAVKALKESRRQCWSAASGVPTWTGTSGAIRRDAQPSNSRPKFGPKKKFGAAKTSTVTSDDAKEESGSGGLLARIRARNLLLNENDETQPADTSIVSRSNADLLDDIRAFVSFGAQTNGQASTDEIVSHFKDRLPSESSALFKQMLNQVCEFHRNSSGVGLWKLLPDFNW